MSSGSQNGMQGRLDQLASTLEERFSDLSCQVERSCGEVTLVVPTDKLIEVANTLH
ncbi:MAG: NADH-quinone oxidoreductase subunit C, partial [Candidatus Thiodiazotropha taylori]|nr:NADH-quinone oxidoreductase subunit C [Candidatus Thiodiazotropha taylori]MCW4251502.1 NADH-quinone oxidoreductase subunit C [Candidatus Thiodiazotropha taylori]